MRFVTLAEVCWSPKPDSQPGCCLQFAGIDASATSTPLLPPWLVSVISRLMSRLPSLLSCQAVGVVAAAAAADGSAGGV